MMMSGSHNYDQRLDKNGAVSYRPTSFDHYNNQPNGRFDERRQLFGCYFQKDNEFNYRTGPYNSPWGVIWFWADFAEFLFA